MASRLYEAQTESVHLQSFFDNIKDLVYSRDPRRDIEIDWEVVPHGISVNFTDSLYPKQVFSKVLAREKLNGAQVSTVAAKEFLEEILNHDGKQAERDIANAERRFIEKTKAHPTGEVLLRILDELKKLNKNRGA